MMLCDLPHIRGVHKAYVYIVIPKIDQEISTSLTGFQMYASSGKYILYLCQY